MTEQTRKPRYVKVAEFDNDFVRDISVEVYRDRVGNDDAETMIAKHGADKFRANAGAYDALTRAYMRALKVAGAPL